MVAAYAARTPSRLASARSAPARRRVIATRRSGDYTLTAKQQQALDLAAAGLPIARIAAAQHCSRSNITKRLARARSLVASQAIRSTYGQHAARDTTEAVMTVTLETPANLEHLAREEDFQHLVVGALRTLGWVVIEIPNMRFNTPGIPDLLCFRAGRGEMIELKIGGRPLSAGQLAWQERWLPEDTTVHLIRNTAEGWEWLMALMT